MADLTVLTSLTPIPVYPSRPRSGFVSRNASYTASSSRLDLGDPGPSSRPTLSRLDLSNGRPRAGSSSSDDSHASTSSLTLDDDEYLPEPEAETPRQTDRITTTDIISPIPSSHPRPTHRPTRSHSAPPERTSFVYHHHDDQSPTPTTAYPKIPNSAGVSEPPGLRHLKGRTHHRLDDSASTASSSSGSPVSSWSYDSPTRRHAGELVRPPPPLHRPTTFWRRTPRSGVTSSNYSPSNHLIRRSTFIAAGLAFDKPGYDGSAYGVESRIAADPQQGKLSNTSQVFWEVIV